MDYLKYWKLSHAPFACDSRSPQFFVGTSIQEAIARAGFLIESNRRLGVLSGPESVGKTSVLRYLQTKLEHIVPQMAVKAQYLSLEGLSDVEFLQWLARSMGASLSMSHSGFTGFRDAWRLLSDASVGLTVGRTTTLFLLDDACSASKATLAVLKRALDLTGPTLFLLGWSQAKLRDIPDFVKERSELRIELPAWDLGQTADYFDHQIESANGVLVSLKLQRSPEFMNCRMACHVG